MEKTVFELVNEAFDGSPEAAAELARIKQNSPQEIRIVQKNIDSSLTGKTGRAALRQAQLSWFLISQEILDRKALMHFYSEEAYASATTFKDPFSCYHALKRQRALLAKDRDETAEETKERIASITWPNLSRIAETYCCLPGGEAKEEAYRLLEDMYAFNQDALKGALAYEDKMADLWKQAGSENKGAIQRGTLLRKLGYNLNTLTK